MTATPRFPAELTRRALAQAHGDGSYVPPLARDAATIVLLRDGTAGLEVFLLRRTRTMAFAPGMHVFPGGRVEEQDADPSVPWTPDARYDLTGQAARFFIAPDALRALLVAAVRETYEESGVLLAVGPDGQPPVRDPADLTWEADRVELLARTLSIAQLLQRKALAIQPDAIEIWTHWVTPEVEDRRYDTRFFVAGLPAGQYTVDVGGESDRVHWSTPHDAIAAYQAGELAMLPPTSATVTELSAYARVADVLAAAPLRTPRPVLPRPVLVGDEVHWTLVDAYDGTLLEQGDGAPPAGSESRGVDG